MNFKYIKTNKTFDYILFFLLLAFGIFLIAKVWFSSNPLDSINTNNTKSQKGLLKEQKLSEENMKRELDQLIFTINTQSQHHYERESTKIINKYLSNFLNSTNWKK